MFTTLFSLNKLLEKVLLLTYQSTKFEVPDVGDGDDFL